MANQSLWQFTFADLQNALNVQTAIALYDEGTGKPNTVAFAMNVDRAEHELVSFLIDTFGWPLPEQTQVDGLLKYSALDYLIGFSIERHPEYAKQAGFGTPHSYYERAKERAERIMRGVQRPVELQEAVSPGNIGGFTVDGSTRMYIPGTDGTPNAGDF